MKIFDKSNFKSEQYAQWQDIFDCVNDSIAICHTTFALPTTVHHYLQNITEPKACQPIPVPTDARYSHSQALKTIHMSTPCEYLMADQDILAP